VSYASRNLARGGGSDAGIDAYFLHSSRSDRKEQTPLKRERKGVLGGGLQNKKPFHLEKEKPWGEIGVLHGPRKHQKKKKKRGILSRVHAPLWETARGSSLPAKPPSKGEGELKKIKYKSAPSNGGGGAHPEVCPLGVRTARGRRQLASLASDPGRVPEDLLFPEGRSKSITSTGRGKGRVQIHFSCKPSGDVSSRPGGRGGSRGRPAPNEKGRGEGRAENTRRS